MKHDLSQIHLVTLKSKDRFLHSNTAKASILNEQFHYIYTREDLSFLPALEQSPFPTMNNITTHERRILKLLKGLHPFKGIGPDKIPAFILKQSAGSIAPYMTICSSSPLIMVRYQMNATEQRSSLYTSTRKGRNINHQTTGLSP